MAIHLSDRQVSAWAERVAQALKSEGYFTPQIQENAVVARLTVLLKGNLKEEQDLERDARTLVDSKLAQMGGLEGVDRHKAFLMAKKQLAKDRGFVS